MIHFCVCFAKLVNFPCILFRGKFVRFFELSILPNMIKIPMWRFPPSLLSSSSSPHLSLSLSLFRHCASVMRVSREAGASTDGLTETTAANWSWPPAHISHTSTQAITHTHTHTHTYTQSDTHTETHMLKDISHLHAHIYSLNAWILHGQSKVIWIISFHQRANKISAILKDSSITLFILHKLFWRENAVKDLSSISSEPANSLSLGWLMTFFSPFSLFPSRVNFHFSMMADCWFRMCVSVCVYVCVPS